MKVVEWKATFSTIDGGCNWKSNLDIVLCLAFLKMIWERKVSLGTCVCTRHWHGIKYLSYKKLVANFLLMMPVDRIFLQLSFSLPVPSSEQACFSSKSLSTCLLRFTWIAKSPIHTCGIGLKWTSDPNPLYAKKGNPFQDWWEPQFTIGKTLLQLQSSDGDKSLHKLLFQLKTLHVMSIAYFKLSKECGFRGCFQRPNRPRFLNMMKELWLAFYL